MKEKLTAFFESDWTPAEKILLLADILLFGILLVWLTSPFKGSKRNFYFGSHVDNSCVCDECGDDDCEEEFDEE